MPKSSKRELPKPQHEILAKNVIKGDTILIWSGRKLKPREAKVSSAMTFGSNRHFKTTAGPVIVPENAKISTLKI